MSRRIAAGGALIDRDRTLRFTFDGRPYTAHPGETIASALLASGVVLMGRSFKYHRPRGLLGAGVEEPNALVGVDRGGGRVEPNARATCVAVADGLVVTSQNRRPSLALDIGAVNDLVSPLIPAGFYYKTFMWPRRFWTRIYEPFIRRAAGLGQPPEVADPDRYAMRHAHCETLIVGAGPAGLAAALAASMRPGRVMLVDNGAVLGGSLLDDDAMIDGLAARDWITAAAATLAERGVTILTGTTAMACGIDNLVTLAETIDPAGGGIRERQWQVRAAVVIAAAGAIERPIVFPNNDRPGIMLAAAAAAFLARYGVLVGDRVVIACRHDSGWRVALQLAGAGCAVTLADERDDPPADLRALAAANGIAVRAGTMVADTRGRRRVRRVALTTRGKLTWLSCDALLMAGGWTPSVHLHSQTGGKVAYDVGCGAFVPRDGDPAFRSVGACRGTMDVGGCLAEGWAAGGGEGAAPTAPDRIDAGLPPQGEPVHPEGSRRKAFVDFQNDVTAKDLRLAVREGFRSVEHLKRYTTNGMATDQGRTSNINALAIAAQARGLAIGDAGLTTFRAPFVPVTFGTMAGHARGELFEPARTTPLHARAVAAGALFEDVGQWKRARCFPHAGEAPADAVARECTAVRERVGIMDACTLGKIEVVGPDAAEFLDRMYTGRSSTLAPNACRYVVLLREDGFILDDGIVARLAPDRFHVTTTSGGAASVLSFMEDFRQTEWPDLSVWLTSTTEQWATIIVNGPQSRTLLAPLVEGIELADLPHMALAHGRIGGAPLMLVRASFTGERGYEVNVPAAHALATWDLIVAAGAPLGAALYGTDASHVLRAEKGYIVIGQETDGTTTPADVGLGKMVAMSKPDFIGKRSLMRPAMKAAGRRQLVAITMPNGEAIDEGMQVVDPATPRQALGHVSSAYRSATQGRWFGLAMIVDGRERVGSRLALATESTPIAVEVHPAVLYDPAGSRHDA